MEDTGSVYDGRNIALLFRIFFLQVPCFYQKKWLELAGKNPFPTDSWVEIIGPRAGLPHGLSLTPLTLDVFLGILVYRFFLGYSMRVKIKLLLFGYLVV